MKHLKLALIVGTMFGASGCLYTNIYQPAAFPRPEVRTDVHDMTVIGPASGESCVTEILSLIATGNAGYDDAYQDALKKSGGTMLFDVKADMHTMSILGGLYATYCSKVTGIAVK